MQGSPIIIAALKKLANHLDAIGLGGLVVAELNSVHNADFRRRQKG